MAKISVVRTYEVEIDDKALKHIWALDAHLGEIVVAATRAADMGNLRGTICICYSFDEDEQLGSYYYLDDPSKDNVVVFQVKYTARETSAIIE